VRWERLRSLLHRGVASGIFPGAVAWVRADGETVFRGEAGYAQVLPELRPVRPDTLFDLASLTKVLCTVPVVLRLHARGLLHLDSPLSRWLRDLEGTPWSRVSLRQALAHTTGLPAWRPLYLRTQGRGRDAVLAAVGAVSPEALPGRRVVYSDLGILLAGLAAERVAGQRTDVLFLEHVAGPLRLRDSRFCPPPPWRRRCAATERGNRYERELAGEAGAGFPWREGVIVGEVHDGNAYYALGGVAPHAGLFSTAEEVARVAEAWVEGSGWLPATLAAEARSDQRRGARGEPRGLGWMLHHPQAFFSAFGRASFGHTGFTGTSVAVDPDRRVVAVLLTNRVHPHVREGIEEFRTEFYRAVASEVCP